MNVGDRSFNPSYTGFTTGSALVAQAVDIDYEVSILLILDMLLEVVFPWFCLVPTRDVSILLILDMLLEVDC